MTERADAGDLEALRALLSDHHEKDEGLTLRAQIGLDKSITVALNEATARREAIRQQFAGMMNEGSENTAEVDAEIAELEAAWEDKSIILNFRARSDRQYRDLVANYPDADDNAIANSEFWAALAEACYTGAERNGKLFTPEQIPLDTIFDTCTFGELTHVRQLVFTMNRAGGDRPFLSRNSRKSPTG